MNNLYIGADLGTSSLKLLLLSSEGEVIRVHSEQYPTSQPYPLWSEQDPEDWYRALVNGLKVLCSGIDSHSIRAIGIAGQMHGLVALDSKNQVIRPAILWNDCRAEVETQYLNMQIGQKQLLDWTGNIAFAGFTAPKLLWLKKSEPDNFQKIAKILLPKDFLIYKLTGKFSSDFSDASGTLLFDVENKQWSKHMLTFCGLQREQLPQVFGSEEVVGVIRPELAHVLQFPPNVRVIAGAGDNAAAAIGAGSLKESSCNISIGTSGTLLVNSNLYCMSENPNIHNFCNANGGYHFLGCILSAASAYQWWVADILECSYAKIAESDLADNYLNSLFFLPYLMGERSPHNDTDARGAFIGLDKCTKQSEMTLAVLEGVCFALRDSLEIIRRQGAYVTESRLVGGGARNSCLPQLLANILNIDIVTLSADMGPALGAAILASTSAGNYASLQEACDAIIATKDIFHPQVDKVLFYEQKYEIYKSLYPALKSIFHKMSSLDATDLR